MFIFHSFRFKDLEKFGKELKLKMSMGKDKETDLIIVHRQIGIVLVEIKSATTFLRGLTTKS